MENSPLSPRAPLSPVGRLTAYGKLAFGHLPTGLGKPAAGFPQPPSFDDDPSLLSMHISNCRHRTEIFDAGQSWSDSVGAGLGSPLVDDLFTDHVEGIVHRLICRKKNEI